MKIINAGISRRNGVNVGIWIKLDKPEALTGKKEKDEWTFGFNVLGWMIEEWLGGDIKISEKILDSLEEV